MFASANGLKAYTTVQNHVQGAEFEKRWFESVIMVLNRIQAGQYDPVTTHDRLIEVRDGLQWVQEDLNERLNSQHRTLLKSIYSTNIRIINGVIETLNTDMLTIVIASVKTILKPYERKTEGAGAPA